MKRTRTLLVVCSLFFGVISCAQTQNVGVTPSKPMPSLKPRPKTVAWGYYDASTPPVLRIQSGETVEVQTLITSSPSRLESAGVSADQVEPALRDIYKEVTNKGPGGHILTGPIYVEGAEPGDVLEVRIRSIRLAIPYAYNAFRPGSGFLPDDFPYSRMKIVPLDERRGGRFAGCTNKRARFSVLLLEELKVADRVEAICGPDTFGIQKPDPEILRRTIAAAGGSLQHAIMIGDSATDIRTARAAGVPVIAVDFGYSDRPVSEFGPDQIISHFAQLPTSIAAIFFAQ